MKSEVYFTPCGAEHFSDSILARLVKLFDRVGAGSIIKEGDYVAVKAHFGEEGNVSFISPVYYRTILDRIKVCGGNPFLTDTNTLYVGHRNNAVKHLALANRHGFSFSAMDAPVVIADGLLGADFVEVPLENGKHFKKVKIASSIYWANTVVVMSHCKGHAVTSFGAALKNIGMGGACRAGKQEQHSGFTPGYNTEKCTGCGECVEWCNFDALQVVDGKIKNDPKKCSGCGECIPVCRFDAIETKWDGDMDQTSEKMAEYAYGALKNKKEKKVFFNFLMNITPECDCFPSSGKFLVPDIGILASFDPVAIDQASVDMINRASIIHENVKDNKDYQLSLADTDKFKMAHPNSKWDIQLRHAQELGLGTREYEIIEVK